MGNRKIKHFTIENKIDEIPSLALKIDQLGKQWKLPQQLVMNINLVIEEALSNIIFYAFTDAASHQIHLSLSVSDNRLFIRITDDGIQFNPLQHEQPDVSLPVGERAVGGLGIFLITQMMDEMDYERKDNQNILTLNKRV